MKNTRQFDAIAGYEKEKSELKDLANVLKNYTTLKDLGGRMPKGLLLLGKNGIGKSFFAKAFIEESELHCESVNISKRDEEFDSHIDEVFANAIKNKPSIIYIDELDKLTAKRDIFEFSDSNYNRFEKLLNCINDHSNEEGIFILATANMEMELDNSLIRSGRIDKIIKIDLPTCKEREAIFNFYAADKKLSEKVEFERFAKETDGFSGADIEAVMNEAAVIACKKNRKTINSNDIEVAITDKKFGTLAKENDLDEESLRVVATHEAGHALVMMFGPEKNINRVTIIPRSGVRGYAETAKDDHKVDPISYKTHYVQVGLGGMAAEEVFYGKLFIGSSSDKCCALGFANDLVTRDGFLGFENIVQEKPHRPGFPEFPAQVSQNKLRRIEKTQARLFNKLYRDTIKLIKKHKKLAISITEALLEKKILDKDDILRLYDSYLNSLPAKEKLRIEKEHNKRYGFKWNA